MACYTLQVAPAGLAAGAREVPLAELVSTYLRAIAPSAYCDPCLAKAVQEPLDPVHQTAEGMEGRGQFVRKLGRCKVCRSTKRIVTRVDPSRF
jgi:hypothetical protein